MASHPEQLRIQLEDAISAGIPYDHLYLEDLDIELLDVIQGKGSSHYIAIFYANHNNPGEVKDFLDGEARSEILDTIASTISRKRIPNITFQVTNRYPGETL